MLTRRNIVLTALAVAVLMAVFAMYTQPDFLVQMANQLWSCF
jgi:hypothetical protein